MDYVDGTHYLCELIKRLSNDRNLGSFHGEFTVTATVGGRPLHCAFGSIPWTCVLQTLTSTLGTNLKVSRERVADL